MNISGNTVTFQGVKGLIVTKDDKAVDLEKAFPEASERHSTLEISKNPDNDLVSIKCGDAMKSYSLASLRLTNVDQRSRVFISNTPVTIDNIDHALVSLSQEKPSAEPQAKIGSITNSELWQDSYSSSEITTSTDSKISLRKHAKTDIQSLNAAPENQTINLEQVMKENNLTGPKEAWRREVEPLSIQSDFKLQYKPSGIAAEISNLAQNMSIYRREKNFADAMMSNEVNKTSTVIVSEEAEAHIKDANSGTYVVQWAGRKEGQPKEAVNTRVSIDHLNEGAYHAAPTRTLADKNVTKSLDGVVMDHTEAFERVVGDDSQESSRYGARNAYNTTANMLGGIKSDWEKLHHNINIFNDLHDLMEKASDGFRHNSLSFNALDNAFQEAHPFVKPGKTLVGDIKQDIDNYTMENFYNTEKTQNVTRRTLYALEDYLNPSLRKKDPSLLTKTFDGMAKDLKAGMKTAEIYEKYANVLDTKTFDSPDKIDKLCDYFDWIQESKAQDIEAAEYSVDQYGEIVRNKEDLNTIYAEFKDAYHGQKDNWITQTNDKLMELYVSGAKNGVYVSHAPKITAQDIAAYEAQKVVK